jgi:hypothetical protein
MGNITKLIDIENKSVSNSLVNLNINSIKLKANNFKSKLQLNTANPFIGSFDLETYLDEGISKVYALGFYTKQHGPKTFYIDENSLNSEELILKCLESMISAKYDKYTFYVHNLGRYDIYFLLNILVKSDKYKIS